MSLNLVLIEMDRRWKASGIPGLYQGSGPEMRERARNIRALLYPKPGLDAGRIAPINIPGPAGDIPARVVWPLGECSGATLVYFHGGGFIVGDLDSHEAHCIRIANRSGAVVVNVGYRLAPEDVFPAGIDDAWAALRWVQAQINQFGGDAPRLAVGGDSAGGNFAAVLALMARDAGLALAAQLLIYPATDLSQERDPTVRNCYLGSEAAHKALDHAVLPLRQQAGPVQRGAGAGLPADAPAICKPSCCAARPTARCGPIWPRWTSMPMRWRWPSTSSPTAAPSARSLSWEATRPQVQLARRACIHDTIERQVVARC